MGRGRSRGGPGSLARVVPEFGRAGRSVGYGWSAVVTRPTIRARRDVREEVDSLKLHTGIALCRACAPILPAHHSIYQRHRHIEIGLCKRFSRCHDRDDANLQRFSKRWWLCLPSQMDLLNISVQSLQSGTCSTGFWGGNLRHHGHHFGQGVVDLRWVHTCLLRCVCVVSREGYRFILVTEVTAVMKTIICSETLQLPTGLQLENARFPRQSVRTDRERCPVDTQGRL
jgi:hypothetical protein